MCQPDQWCFAWLVPPQGTPGQNRAGALIGCRWTPGQYVTVSFLEGSPSIQDRVRQTARRWTLESGGPANLVLDFRNKGPTDIRISFQYPGSWSAIGTTCRQIIDQGQPTMNLGTLRESSTDDEVTRAVLHEFGHVLGLVHEHESAGGQIAWDRDAVIADLSAPPFNWSMQAIEANMFHPYTAAETNFTRLDPTSIMIYPIPDRWTTDGTSVGLNKTLSKQDVDFVRGLYQ